MTIPARDLQPGDVFTAGEWSGWRVKWAIPNATADFWYGDDEDGEFTEDFVTLLTLEHENVVEDGVAAMTVYGPPDRHYAAVPPKTETQSRRTWLHANEECEVGRGDDDPA